MTFRDRAHCLPHAAGVYVLGSTFLGFYKVGMAINLCRRVDDYASSVPFHLDYLSAWLSDKPNKLEAQAHDYLDGRLNENGSVTEWFCLREAQVWRLEDFLTDLAGEPLSTTDETRERQAEIEQYRNVIEKMWETSATGAQEETSGTTID